MRGTPKNSSGPLKTYSGRIFYLRSFAVIVNTFLTRDLRQAAKETGEQGGTDAN